jgi:hypothetical protein
VPDTGVVDRVVEQALAAMADGRWDQVRAALHPYLQWRDADGATLRGRTKVMARLREGPPTAPPSSYELRDGQIYRWTV